MRQGENKMQIRASQKEDITAIMRIYEKARAFMDQTGNPTQWGDGYPQRKNCVNAAVTAVNTALRQEDLEE